MNDSEAEDLPIPESGMNTRVIFVLAALLLGGSPPSSAGGPASGTTETWPGNAPWTRTRIAFETTTPTATESMTLDAFKEVLSDGRFMPNYNAGRLRQLVDRYNLSQDRRFGVKVIRPGLHDFADGIDLRPKGYSQLDVADWGEYFAIYVETADETHTDMIDGGRDSYAAIFFTKRPATQVREIPAPVYPLGDLVLSIPQTYSCMGFTPGGEIAVHDLRSETIFSASLPEGTISLALEEPAGSTIRFSTRSEVPSSQSRQHEVQCEVGSWVKKIDATFSLACNRAKQRCTLRRLERTVSEGCQDIGGCD